ncbi:MAG: acetyltransferase [Plesiomonas shigelloides]
MNKRIIGVYGASGFGREVMPLVKQQIDCDVVFIDDTLDKKEVNGVPVIRYSDFVDLRNREKHVIIAIADSKIREMLSLKLLDDDIKQFSVIASNSINLCDNNIGDGVILCPFTTVTSNVKIGKAFHANIYSYIAHDCIIGDYVTFAPNVMCNGNVHIHDHVYIGTGAMIKQGTPDKPLIIGEGAVIGMGSVVTKSVKPGDVVFGVPAKSIKRG